MEARGRRACRGARAATWRSYVTSTARRLPARASTRRAALALLHLVIRQVRSAVRLQTAYHFSCSEPIKFSSERIQYILTSQKGIVTLPWLQCRTTAARHG